MLNLRETTHIMIWHLFFTMYNRSPYAKKIYFRRRDLVPSDEKWELAALKGRVRLIAEAPPKSSPSLGDSAAVDLDEQGAMDGAVYRSAHLLSNIYEGRSPWLFDRFFDTPWPDFPDIMANLALNANLTADECVSARLLDEKDEKAASMLVFYGQTWSTLYSATPDENLDFRGSVALCGTSSIVRIARIGDIEEEERFHFATASIHGGLPWYLSAVGFVSSIELLDAIRDVLLFLMREQRRLTEVRPMASVGFRGLNLT
jgi:hypothetical protein